MHSDRAQCVRQWAVGLVLAASVGTAATCSTPQAHRRASTLAQPDALALELDRRFSADVAPLLATYCFKCHTGDDAKADLHLDQFTSSHDFLTGDVDTRLLRDMVSIADMPPPKHPHPSDHERLIITQWMDAMIAYVPADAPIDPGWFTPHRLNRTEYRLTMRDLLGIDPQEIDIAAKLPADDTGYGFDNIADVLSTSPLAIEQYLEAAEHAVEIALGPVVDFGDSPRALRPLEGNGGQPLPRGGFFLYSRGGASGTFEAPLTGDYSVRVKAWETRAGDEHARLSLRIDNGEVQAVDVTGTRDEPQDFEFRVRLERGTRVVSAHFLNDYYVKDVADRNLGIESISVAGPLDEETSERPAAWTAVFAPAAQHHREGDRARAVLTAFAFRAYRRPPTPAQVDALMRVYQSERDAGGGFEAAVRTGLTASLVSPHFIFRAVTRPISTPAHEPFALDGYELASRLSYFLWSSMPDQALFDAAANGSLRTDAGLTTQVHRMLADPRSDAMVEHFSGQWLQLRTLDTVAIDRAKFPEYDDNLRAAMNTEATLFFRDVVRSDRSILSFIDSPDTFLNARLASLYSIPGVEGGEFRKVRLPEGSRRGGVLTMGAVLTLTSNTTRTSPVKRGLFVLDQMLGTPPPPPPPDIPPLEQATKSDPDATVRERLAAHVTNPTCAACHNRLDPLGLAFERFDAIGRLRDTENGKPIDDSGTLPGGERLEGADDVKQAVLKRADQFVEALSAKLLTYATGRGIEPFDRPAVRQIAARTRSQGDRFSALVESIVLSETFRTCRERTREP